MTTTLKETPTEGSYQWAFYEYVNNRQSCQWIRDLMHNTLLHCEGYRETELRKPMKATVADVTRLKAQIDKRSLCHLFPNRRRGAETEAMVAQTISAAVINANGDPGEPLSWRGKGVFSSSGNGIVDNATAYGMLVSQGYFIEEQRQNQTAIFPSKKLVQHLDNYFAQ
jgi:hypothetical protein